MRYQYILFDLDGTLSDPKDGITKSVQYALQKMGISIDNLDELEGFIGPPLHVSFAEQYHLNEEEIIKAVNFYRERFRVKGMYENTLYPNIYRVLEHMKKSNVTLLVATSKPTVFAEEILKYFQIEHYFELIIGSELDGSRSSKTEIIQYILDQYPESSKHEFIMVGDRKHDIIGAHNTQIDSIGVTYGYGSNEEIIASRPTYLVHSVEDLQRILLK